MARRSLSSQVLEVTGRVDRVLSGASSIVDPMTAHMISEAREGLAEIRNLCLKTLDRESITESRQAAAAAAAAGAAAAGPKPARKAPQRSRKPSAAGGEA